METYVFVFLWLAYFIKQIHSNMCSFILQRMSEYQSFLMQNSILCNMPPFVYTLVVNDHLGCLYLLAFKIMPPWTCVSKCLWVPAFCWIIGNSFLNFWGNNCTLFHSNCMIYITAHSSRATSCSLFSLFNLSIFPVLPVLQVSQKNSLLNPLPWSFSFKSFTV